MATEWLGRLSIDTREKNNLRFRYVFGAGGNAEINKDLIALHRAIGLIRYRIIMVNGCS